jgi:hypothetical protein
VADLAKWNVHGPVASLKTELAEWDLHSGYWKPAGHFTVATFRRDGAISSTDGYSPDGSVARSRWIYDESGRLMESHSWMNDDTPHRSLYLYDDAGRHVRTFAVSLDLAETDVETSSYDAGGRRTKVSVFGSRAGNVFYSIEGTDMGLTAAGAVRVVVTYDHNDLPFKEVLEDAKQNPVGQVIMRRDSAGRLVKVEMHMGGPSMFSMCGQSDQPIPAEADKALSLMMESLGGSYQRPTTLTMPRAGLLNERVPCSAWVGTVRPIVTVMVTILLRKPLNIAIAKPTSRRTGPCSTLRTKSRRNRTGSNTATTTMGTGSRGQC